MKLTTHWNIPALTLAIVLLGSSCHKNEAPGPTNQCDSTNTTFNQLYNNVLSFPNMVNDTTMDLEVHSYTFKVSSPETICEIGYQNLSPTNTQPYLIEIYDSTNNTLLYSGNHVFSQVNTSYVSINPVTLTVGNSYTIRRVQTMTTFTSDLIGRMIQYYGGHIPFPVTFGNLKITSVSFSTDPTQTTDVGLPYIDLVFQ